MAKNIISSERQRELQNDLCKCGSSRKFKNCCMKKERTHESDVLHF
ncbi:MAG: SEC-C domain-containing protein [Bdellovibrionales bacterium]|nr:SEC-C domain-containing protein [Bdellovibrionales bacterium]